MSHSLAARLPRWVAAGYLIIVEPTWMALVADGALPRLIDFGAPALAVLVVRVLVAAGGVAAGLAVWRGEATAPTLGRVWAAASLVGATITALTPYFPRSRPPSEQPLALLTAIVFYAAWYLAFARQAHADDVGFDAALDLTQRPALQNREGRGVNRPRS